MDELKHGILGTIFSGASFAAWLADANAVLTFAMLFFTVLWWARKVIFRFLHDVKYLRRWQIPPSEGTREIHKENNEPKPPREIGPHS